MPQNPFYCKGNPELDDVASALSIPRDELSQYVHQTLKTNLVAWVSEQRLRHCAEAIALADRKITEIAAATGYNDVPTFTRAFKRQYGVAQSEYRKKEKDS
jgi:AraC-like DNA-binding protein